MKNTDSRASVHTFAEGRMRVTYQPNIKRVIVRVGDDAAMHLEVDAGHLLIDRLRDALRVAVIHQAAEEDQSNGAGIEVTE